MTAALAAPLSPAPSPAIVLDDIRVAFGTGTTSYIAVDNVNLTVAEGEFVAIVGPTGCGKSTLLNVAAGLLPPAAGRAKVQGKPVVGLTRAAGYLFQQDALMPWKTAVANVTIAPLAAGMAAREADGLGRDWLRKVGLSRFADRYPHQLSGGQRKRVALAQMLIRNPSVLLMDEPFGPLDAQTRSLMGDLLLSLWSADRKAVLFVTHDLDEAISLADRVVVMSAGPASRILSDHTIDLPRPRETSEIRLDPRFHALQRAIWNDLRAEVMRAYADEEGNA
jgi:NitT/TauT family transport system ATP-binding protein